MKNEKRFKFNPEQFELISNSFNEFKNDAIKEIAADNSVGGKIVVHIKIIFTKGRRLD